MKNRQYLQIRMSFAFEKNIYLLGRLGFSQHLKNTVDDRPTLRSCSVGGRLKWCIAMAPLPTL